METRLSFIYTRWQNKKDSMGGDPRCVPIPIWTWNCFFDPRRLPKSPSFPQMSKKRKGKMLPETQVIHRTSSSMLWRQDYRSLCQKKVLHQPLGCVFRRTVEQYENMTQLHVLSVHFNFALNGGSHNSRPEIQLDDKENRSLTLEALCARRAEMCSPLAKRWLWVNEYTTGV